MKRGHEDVECCAQASSSSSTTRKAARGKQEKRRKLGERFVDPLSAKGHSGFLLACVPEQEARAVKQLESVLSELGRKETSDATSAIAGSTLNVGSVSDALKEEIKALKAGCTVGDGEEQFFKRIVLPARKGLVLLRWEKAGDMAFGNVVSVARLLCSGKYKNRVPVIFRIVPLELFCHSRNEEISKACGELAQKFLDLEKPETKTYAFQIRKRLCGHLEKGELIKGIAARLDSVFPKDENGHEIWNANLKDPELALIVEIAAGIAGVSAIRRPQDCENFKMNHHC